MYCMLLLQHYGSQKVTITQYDYSKELEWLGIFREITGNFRQKVWNFFVKFELSQLLDQCVLSVIYILHF